jgi:hypothetical protein
MFSKRFETGVKTTGLVGIGIAGFLLLWQQRLFEAFMVFSQSIVLIMFLRSAQQK